MGGSTYVLTYLTALVLPEENVAAAAKNASVLFEEDEILFNQMLVSECEEIEYVDCPFTEGKNFSAECRATPPCIATPTTTTRSAGYQPSGNSITPRPASHSTELGPGRKSGIEIKYYSCRV